MGNHLERVAGSNPALGARFTSDSGFESLTMAHLLWGSSYDQQVDAWLVGLGEK